ncbi:phage head-tail joining protein [Rhodopseudomonas sp. NSM]|uniref:phage head-tail joining protein n=1 Tax=Rhodopseudomonas sp. NSM TaxID=3457630 RepID=UPI004035D253
MATAEDLQAQRVALVAARGSGELRVIFHSGGTRREVEYRSVAEITAAIAAIDRDLASLQGRRVTTFLPTFSNGIE